MKMRPGTRPAKRSTRVGELLREILAAIMLERVADPRLQELTITEVEMSLDLKLAKVYYAVRQGSNPEELMMALDKALGFIKQEVAREHILRTMPEFHFLPDETLDKAERLELLLESLHKGKEKEF
jgi:ribosome-binding factor A|uniref:Ribosome-binding factor A n=1 Tax=Desulfobacca acetoxidans TaxID=60893 RepID=A0A7V6A692_9BACT